MIETTYIRLSQAAAMLETDEDTLLIAAAEGRIRPYWIFDERIDAEKGNWVISEDGNCSWIAEEFGFNLEFHFLPMIALDALGLVKRKKVKAQIYLLGETYDQKYWRPVQRSTDDINEETKYTISRHDVFFERAVIVSIKESNATPSPGTVKDQNQQTDRQHVSDNLAMANQAARRWWANADKKDPSTQPDNDSVIEWLIEKGMNESTAKATARIIRPEWAHKGRKPEQ